MMGLVSALALSPNSAIPARILVSEFISDCRKVSVARAGRRALRKSLILAMADGYHELFATPAYQQHVATATDNDRLFFLSERQYLATGLTARQRLAAAIVHYRHESQTFDDHYLERVYRGGGLVLWREDKAGVSYDIRLVPGKDVSQEGALSIIFQVDGACVCILSYSLVPTRMLLDGAPAETEDGPLSESILFLTRKHLSRDHSYQAHFNKAFDRTTPAHLCFGALTGLALAQGHRHVFGIDPGRHPAFSYTYKEAFISAYTDFWTSMAGRKISPYGYLVDLPIRLTPLGDLEPAKRKRAMARRAHIDAAQRSAQDAVTAYLRQPKF